MDADPTPVQQRSSRKHLRSSDEYDESDMSSDVSGRFDDAEELIMDLDSCNSPSAKSSKRCRASDWPLPDEAADYGHHDRRNAQKIGNITSSYRASPKASPRISIASLRNRHKAASSTSPRSRLGRRSRFVEATMSDSVSEKPPSIFFRDVKGNGSNRGSGIFRFGKTIAAAFNPFGVWGKQPEHAAKPESETDALTQAEAAYAELKKAGFKGTNKGAYTQNQRVDPAIADETWQAIADKMGMNTAVGTPMTKSHDQRRHATSPRPSAKTSKNSSHGSYLSSPPSLPFIRHESTVPYTYSNPVQTSEDSENNIVRRQKSRKELMRQAKLLKKVSNLEDKLERARRELRTLAGDVVNLPPISKEAKPANVQVEADNYPRKFVPGALPSLPSERLLDQKDILADMPEFDVNQFKDLTSVHEDSACPEETRPNYSTKVVTKSPRRRESRPSILGKESSSLKRKSPNPEPVASRSPQPIPTGYLDEELKQIVKAALLSPSRQSKWQKFDAGDSPGMVERTRSGNMDGQNQFCLPSTSQSRASIVRSPPLIRTSRGSFNLRSISSDSMHDASSNDLMLSPTPPPIEAHQSFYLQQHSQLDPDCTTRPTHPNFSPSPTRGSKHDEEVPPVPPLPKELPMSAFKAKKSEKKAPVRKATVLSPQDSSVQNQQQAQQSSYLWPEDCF